MVDTHTQRHSKKLPAARESTNTISSQTNTAPHIHADTTKQPSRASSLEIENLVKVSFVLTLRAGLLVEIL